MRRNFRSVASTLVAVALAGLLAACGGTPEDAATSTAESAQSSEVTTEAGNEASAEKPLDDYAVLAMEQAQVAADSGTFGVGGVLLDTDGNVICEMHNKVIDGSHINDPTAHGERQIVDWYLANKEKEGLPEPEDCILITTLDPCVMCTGAITQANFGKVIVIALDDFAGINWEGTSACSALDGTDAQEYVREHFAYPEVTGELAREAFGADLSDVDIFSDVTVTSETLKGCQDAFNLSADAVRSKVAASSVEAADVQDPAKLDETHPIRAYLAEKFGTDFLACTWKPGEAPDAFLSYVEKAHPGFDGVAYFDQFGNLIFLADNDPDISVQSAFMRTTRKVAEARNSEPIEGYDVDAFLQNPRNGYFVYMTCPKPSAKTIMELGAIGSTLENTAEHPIMYINGAENEKEIESLIAQLPPLYKNVIGIDFEQITPAASE